MIERLKEIADDRMRDTLLVVVPNGTVLSVVRLVDLKTIFEIALITVTLAYTIWRWRKDSQKP